MGYTYKAIIAGNEYLASEIYSCSCENSLMNNQLEVGNVAAGRFDITIRPKADDIPAMSKVEFFMHDSEGSPWIPRGTYYVHNWTLDSERNRITLECYDIILSLDVPYTGTYPTTMQSAVANIGIPLSSGTFIKPYTLSYKNSRTKREVLQDIASAHAGNFTITMDGYLRLVPIYEQLNEFDIERSVATYNKNKEQLVIQAVSMRRDDGTVFSTGTATNGLRLYIHNANATQEMTNDIYAKVNGYIHNPFSATKAYIDPKFNLGDTVIIDDNKHVINAFRITYSATIASDLSSPFSVGADFVGEIERELARMPDTIEEIVTEALENFDPEVISTIVNNEIIVNNLTAENGRISNLTVNRLRTDYMKAWRYLAGDTSPINFINAQDETYQMITAETTGTVSEQFTTLDGEPLYWHDDNIGTYMTVNKTNSPVMVYVYEEHVKFDHSFQEIQWEGGSSRGPVMVFGQGTGVGDNGKGFIYKDAFSFRLKYVTTTGKEHNIEFGEDGIKIEPFIWRGTEAEYNALSADEKAGQMLSILV